MGFFVLPPPVLVVIDAGPPPIRDEAATGPVALANLLETTFGMAGNSDLHG